MKDDLFSGVIMLLVADLELRRLSCDSFGVVLFVLCCFPPSKKCFPPEIEDGISNEKSGKEYKYHKLKHL